MEFKFGGSETNQKTVLGQPSGLFIIFFTEMWERFSYYGMKFLLVLFLTASLTNKGWSWSRSDAMLLLAWYTALVYVTPIIGGFISDKFIGYRKGIVIGASIMTLGHAFMALTGGHMGTTFFYVGLLLLVVGSGFFKPNTTSIIGQFYKKTQGREKDAGYSIFYMGVNSGAFLGIFLCGYIGEVLGWHYGFGLAGVFMLFGTLQFYFSQEIFGEIGVKPKRVKAPNDTAKKPIVAIEAETEVANHKPQKATASELDDNPKVVRDRIVVIGIFSLFAIFFWWAFEQSAGVVNIFARDYTNRILEGHAALAFKVVDMLMVVIPMLIITWVLKLLFAQVYRKYPLASILLGTSFIVIWGFVICVLIKNFQEDVAKIPATWFGILNSIFIILLTPLFSKIWESRYNPSGPVKYALGMILMGLSFAVLAYGSLSIPDGAKTGSVGMFYLIVFYLLYTSAELSLSPISLSYISKLSPVKLMSFMFGVFSLSSFLGNFLAGFTGSYVDTISKTYGMSGYFFTFTIILLAVGFIMILLNPMIKRKMHGIK